MKPNLNTKSVAHIGISNAPYHTPLNKSVTICGLTAEKYYHEKHQNGLCRGLRKHVLLTKDSFHLNEQQYILCSNCLKSFKRNG